MMFVHPYISLLAIHLSEVSFQMEGYKLLQELQETLQLQPS
jgi:hypothetical protein